MSEGSLPRIFVGTLACGEAEFEACCEAVAAQQGVQVTHHVIENQPEYEAHNALWEAWNRNKASHDLFVKIDADTVLNRDTALKEIADLFRQKDVTGAQILLLDYYTDDLISGLNAFSPQVQFQKAKSQLFADHADTGHKIVLKGEAVRHMAPIAWHGKDPSSHQSFHFGFRRRLKKQKDILRKTAVAWLKHRDVPRGWALAGAASAKWWMVGYGKYKNKFFENCYINLQDDLKRQCVIEEFIRKHYGDLT